MRVLSSAFVHLHIAFLLMGFIAMYWWFFRGLACSVFDRRIAATEIHGFLAVILPCYYRLLLKLPGLRSKLHAVLPLALDRIFGRNPGTHGRAGREIGSGTHR